MRHDSIIVPFVLVLEEGDNLLMMRVGLGVGIVRAGEVNDGSENTPSGCICNKRVPPANGDTLVLLLICRRV